jgi:hypothetical protein
LCSSSAICVVFLRCFLHFLLCLSRDQVSVWCVPSVCLILASKIPVCRRDHGNFFSYLRLDVVTTSHNCAFCSFVYFRSMAF